VSDIQQEIATLEKASTEDVDQAFQQMLRETKTTIFLL